MVTTEPETENANSDTKPVQLNKDEELDMKSLSKITEEIGLVLNDNSETSIR